HLHLEFEDGTTRDLVSDSSWLVTDVPRPDWKANTIEPAAWTNAKEIAVYGGAPWARIEAPRLFLPPPPPLPQSFRVSKPVARATVFASALGLFELELDGKKVGTDLFTPGWTDYRKRVPYRAYDVTPLLAAGEHALGARLGDGWYAGYVGYGGHRNHY